MSTPADEYQFPTLVRRAFRGAKVRRVRNFDLQVALYPHNNLVLDVLNSMEFDRLMVFDENKRGVLAETCDAVGPLDLYVGATKPASIRHWLPAGCQVIRWDIPGEIDAVNRKRGVMALYRQNAADVMFPVDVRHLPPGPSAFLGEIVFNQELLRNLNQNAAVKNMLRFVLAHELTHVFDVLRFLIPALKNWRRFWRNVLDEGEHCNHLACIRGLQGVFVDDYGSKNELEIVKKYWPSRADKWFQACRGTESDGAGSIS